MSEKFIKIRVFDFKFIDQDNVAIPRERLREDPKYLDSACLRVSQRPTAAGINNPGLNNPRYRNLGWPSTDASRSAVVRFQVDSNYAGAPSLGSADVRVTRRPQPGNSAVPTFEHVYQCKTQNEATAGPTPFRVYSQIRLVSNPNDDTPVAPMEDWQTIRVQLGDRVRAELLVDGQHVTFLELPVGAPPLGSSGLASAKNAIKTASVRFLRVELDSVPSLDMQKTVERMSEDLAQIGVRAKSTGSAQIVRQKVNLFYMVFEPAGSTGYISSGGLLVNGQQVSVSAQVPADYSTFSATKFMASKVAIEIGAATGLETRHAMYGAYGCVVVNPGVDVSIQVNQNFTHAIQTDVYVPAWYGSGYPLSSPIVFEYIDQAALCMNYSDNYDDVTGSFWALHQGAGSIDFYVFGASVILPAPPPANQVTANSVPWAEPWMSIQSAFCGTTFLPETCVDADDSAPLGYWPIPAHELVHHLSRRGETTGGTCTDGNWHIVNDASHMMKGSAGVENWQGPKRLPDDCCLPQFRERDLRKLNSSSSSLDAPKLLFEFCN
jgi:hypothetical protein